MSPRGVQRKVATYPGQLERGEDLAVCSTNGLAQGAADMGL